MQALLRFVIITFVGAISVLLVQLLTGGAVRDWGSVAALGLAVGIGGLGYSLYEARRSDRRA